MSGQCDRGVTVRQGTAYIATTRYKFNDHRPGLYKTTDYGATWTKIDNGIPANAFTRVVREDDVRRDLLFAGTELGVFISWNGGRKWSPFQMNLPITPDNGSARAQRKLDRRDVGTIVLDSR